MTPFPKLETARLVLRELVASDVPALTVLYEDKQAMKLRGADRPENPEQLANMVSWFASARPVTGETQWGIERKATPGIIGICGLRGWDTHVHQCLLGYELCPAQRGKGYIDEALRAALAWAFWTAGFNRVSALVHAENQPSRRVLRRLGFSFEGVMRQAGRWNNEYHDLMGFGLLRPEFAAPAEAIRGGTDGPHSQTTPGTAARSAEPEPWRVAA